MHSANLAVSSEEGGGVRESVEDAAVPADDIQEIVGDGLLGACRNLHGKIFGRHVHAIPQGPVKALSLSGRYCEMF